MDTVEVPAMFQDLVHAVHQVIVASLRTRRRTLKFVIIFVGSDTLSSRASPRFTAAQADKLEEIPNETARRP